jgi:aminomethyltransferase
MSAPDTPAPALARTPLHNLHLTAGARMAPFAGYEMPIHYKPGILKEHLHTRATASLFDVSHMGQITLRPRFGKLADAARALERLVPADVMGLAPGRQRYAFFTDANGGIVDDLMIGHCGDLFMLIVNASRKHVDLRLLRDAISDACTVHMIENQALIALQGPKAEAALARLAPAVSAMRFMDVRMVMFGGASCLVCRSGYTGEDGFEISVRADHAEALARTLLDDSAVAWAGLGARDSLRIEAGLCLYGADIDETTTPAEAALEWAIQKARRLGGARAGGFPGAARVLEQIESGAPRRRAGLKPRDRTPVRAGAALYADATASQPIGAVTSGGFGPSAAAPVAMGYVPAFAAAPGRALFAEVRARRIAIEVVPLPFVPHRYKRKRAGGNPQC